MKQGITTSSASQFPADSHGSQLRSVHFSVSVFVGHDANGKHTLAFMWSIWQQPLQKAASYVRGVVG